MGQRHYEKRYHLIPRSIPVFSPECLYMVFINQKIHYILIFVMLWTTG